MTDLIRQRQFLDRRRVGAVGSLGGSRSSFFSNLKIGWRLAFVVGGALAKS